MSECRTGFTPLRGRERRPKGQCPIVCESSTFQFVIVITHTGKQKMDQTQWIRVVTNLIQNALHSVSKKKTPQIGVQIVTEPIQTIISITDNGSGIPDKLKSKIFEPKFTTKSAGMGLGLGIVKNIIKSHNGKISFVSTHQKGTTFSIVLPKD